MFLAQVNYSFALCTAIVDGGDWSNAATWDCAGGPAHGETMVIPDGITVEVDCNCGVYNNMTIIIEDGGTLNFPNGRKINLDANGVVQIDDGGLVTGGNGGAKLIIDGVEMWNGSDDDVAGPTSVSAAGWLPIDLVSFNAIANEKTVEISWITASEINNDYFIIERSGDGLVWEEVVEAKGAGTSNTIISYFEIDPEPLMGLSYYRISQFDFNGKNRTFNIVPVEIIATNNGTMSVFPNPAKKGEKINVSFKDLGCENDREILVVLRDVKGNEVYSKVELVDCKDGLAVIGKTRHLASGTYLVIASSDNLLYSQKVIIK